MCINVIYIYDSMGVYFVKLMVYNNVLKEVVSILVNIISNLCDKFIVKIVGEDFKDFLEKIEKFEILILKYEVIYRCFVVVRIVFMWSVFIVIWDDYNNESVFL